MQGFFYSLSLFLSRKHIQVDEIFVHENYTTTGYNVNDIALLRLGESYQLQVVPVFWKVIT